MIPTTTAYLMGNALWVVDAYELPSESHNKVVEMWREAVRPGTSAQLFDLSTPHHAFMRAHPDFGNPTLLRSSDDHIVRQSLPDDENVLIYSVQTSPHNPETDFDPTIEIMLKTPEADHLKCTYAGRLVQWSNDLLAGLLGVKGEVGPRPLHTLRVAPHQIVSFHLDHVVEMTARARDLNREDWVAQLERIEQRWGTGVDATPTPYFG
jgi:hypothetical protein